MIVDTSAIVAIVRDEPEADRCLNLILQAPDRRISAGNLLEAYLVIDGARTPALSEELDANIADFQLVTEPVTPEHVRIAREAFRRYGKGSRHPARLNYGDCFAAVYPEAHRRTSPLSERATALRWKRFRADRHSPRLMIAARSSRC